jgi:aminopeptidase N
MSIYAISSYKPYLESLSSFIFDVTINSMKFYTSFFGFPFSFPKYDQVWVHEFIAGAMENAGIVTFNDATTLFKETPTSVQYFDLANTITHELAHHWFGDLVTMRWWDDLWLNESFADFISHFCLEKINKDLTYQYASCMAYYRDRKQWGYE